MHVVLLLTEGVRSPEAALTLNRVALGLFFAISGYHKLFNAGRHATLTRTLQDDRVHAVPVMQWLLPSAEFCGGWALILGFLSVLAAFGLFVICAGACVFDAVKRIRAWQPIDRADWLGDLLYIPETLYCIGLSVVMLGGPGTWRLDATILAGVLERQAPIISGLRDARGAPREQRALPSSLLIVTRATLKYN